MPTVPKKQSSDQGQWLAVVDALRSDMDVTRRRARVLVDQAAARVSAVLPAGATAAYGWSGGKDSQAIRAVAEAAGVTESVLVLTDLEFPAFVSFCTAQMPDHLTVVKRPWDLDWLKAHEDMIFPSGSTPGRWFTGVQHWGQRRFARQHGISHMLLGRRGADGNFRGPNGDGSYRDRDGFERVSPIFDWSHDDLLAVCVGMDLPLAPIYDWPRGYRVGTGPWPARQWVADEAAGWAEVYEIDPSVVVAAADAGVIGARTWLEGYRVAHDSTPGSCAYCAVGLHVDCAGTCSCSCPSAGYSRRRSDGKP